MTIQRIFITLLFGLVFFWKGPDLIHVKGLEATAVNERLFSGLFCAASFISVLIYTFIRGKIGLFNAVIFHWLVLSLLAHLFIRTTHSFYWHSLLVNAFGVLATFLLFETWFFIRRLEEK